MLQEADPQRMGPHVFLLLLAGNNVKVHDIVCECLLVVRGSKIQRRKMMSV